MWRNGTGIQIIVYSLQLLLLRPRTVFSTGSYRICRHGFRSGIRCNRVLNCCVVGLSSTATSFTTIFGYPIDYTITKTVTKNLWETRRNLLLLVHSSIMSCANAVWILQRNCTIIDGQVWSTAHSTLHEIRSINVRSHIGLSGMTMTIFISIAMSVVCWFRICFGLCMCLLFSYITNVEIPTRFQHTHSLTTYGPIRRLMQSFSVYCPFGLQWVRVSVSHHYHVAMHIPFTVTLFSAGHLFNQRT